MKRGEEVNREDFSEDNWETYKKYLIMGVIVLIILLIMAVIWILSSSNKINKTSDNTLSNCLEKDNLDNDCRKLFLNSELYAQCENFGRLRNKCLYFTAVSNGNMMLCPSIDDSLLKTKCEREVFVTGEL